MKQLFIVIGVCILLAASLVSAEEHEFAQFNGYAKESIKQKALDVAKQIEIYLKLNPDLTVKDLQNDEYFQTIAVQGIGKTGYTAVTDYDTLTCRFHKNPKIVNLELRNLADKFPGFWSIMSRTQGGIEAEGVYDWEEADGSIKKKYMFIALVNIKTAGGVGLHVAATTYLDEYEEESISFIEEKEEETTSAFELSTTFKAFCHKRCLTKNRFAFTSFLQEYSPTFRPREREGNPFQRSLLPRREIRRLKRETAEMGVF